MKITVGTLAESNEALGWMSEQKTLKSKDKFALALLLVQVSGYLKAFEETRQAAINNYGVVEGDRFRILPENLEAFTTEMGELTSQECELPDVSIDVESLIDEMTTAQLVQLDWLLIRDESE